MTRSLILSPFVLATACSSSGGIVESFGSVPDIGPVRAAVYTPAITVTEPVLLVTPTGLADATPSPSGTYTRTHTLTLFTAGTSCGELQRLEEQRAEAVYDLLNATDDGSDGDALCSRMPEYFQAADGGPGGSAVHISFCLAGEDCGAPEVGGIGEATGSYVVVESGAPSWGQAMVESWNESACEPGLGADEGSTRYRADTIDLLISSVEADQSLSGSFAGDLADTTGSSVGNIAGEFEAQWCDIGVLAPVIIF